MARKKKTVEQEIEALLIKECSRRFVGIIRFGPWIHARNAVVNCLAITNDGFIQYKFSVTYDWKLLVAEVRDTHWINLGVKVGDVITFEELKEKITGGKYRDVFKEHNLVMDELDARLPEHAKGEYVYNPAFDKTINAKKKAISASKGAGVGTEGSQAGKPR